LANISIPDALISNISHGSIVVSLETSATQIDIPTDQKEFQLDLGYGLGTYKLEVTSIEPSTQRAGIDRASSDFKSIKDLIESSKFDNMFINAFNFARDHIQVEGYHVCKNGHVMVPIEEPRGIGSKLCCSVCNKFVR